MTWSSQNFYQPAKLEHGLNRILANLHMGKAKFWFGLPPNSLGRGEAAACPFVFVKQKSREPTRCQLNFQDRSPILLLRQADGPSLPHPTQQPPISSISSSLILKLNSLTVPKNVLTKFSLTFFPICMKSKL